MKTIKNVLGKGILGLALISLGMLSSCEDNNQLEFSENDSMNVDVGL